MAQLLVLYNTPADPTAFDRYYHHTAHSAGPEDTRSAFVCDQQRSGAGSRRDRAGSDRDLDFDSLADLNAALASPEGQAAAADLSNFASGGATLLIYDIKAV